MSYYRLLPPRPHRADEPDAWQRAVGCALWLGLLLLTLWIAP